MLTTKQLFTDTERQLILDTLENYPKDIPEKYWGFSDIWKEGLNSIVTKIVQHLMERKPFPVMEDG